MKHRLVLVLLLLISCVCREPLFAQTRLDIAFEGPWLFYREPAFALVGGSTVPALIAVSPQVLGHFSPIFSTGDGITLNPGIYCVAFDGACAKSNMTTLTNDGYPDPGLLKVSKGSWNWTSLSSAYVLILPMPDSYSADGKYTITLHSAFPRQNVPSPSTSSLHLQLVFSCTT